MALRPVKDETGVGKMQALTLPLQHGEAQNGPLILSALWLAANRKRLRRDA